MKITLRLAASVMYAAVVAAFGLALPSPSHAQQECDIAIGFQGSFAAIAITFSLNAGSAGTWATDGPVADCTSVDPSRGSGVGFITGDPAELGLTMNSGIEPLSGGYDIVTCKLIATGTPSPGDFSSEIAFAVDATGQPIVPAPTPVVRSVSCGAGPTTTTLSNTTTTTFGSATTTTLDPGPAQECEVAFRIDDPASISIFTADISYSAAGGEIAGVPGNLEGDCTLNPAIAVTPGNFGTNNAPQNKLLRVDFTAELGGLQTPIDFMTCRYLPEPGTTPQASDFVGLFTAIFDTGFQPILPPPAIVTTSLECMGGPGTTTTTLPGGLCICGDPVAPSVSNFGSPRAINATDALFTLNASVGSEQCELCACDINGSGTVNATDALQVLQAAVGQPVVLNCPLALP